MNNEFGKVSLELARKMKELRFEQESEWYWWQEVTPSSPNRHEYKIPQEDMEWKLCLGKPSIISGNNVYREYSAYTVAELGEMLKDWIGFKTYHTFTYKNYKQKGKYIWGIFVGSNNPVNDEWHFLQEVIADTEADARAKMLIWLKENGYLK